MAKSAEALDLSSLYKSSFFNQLQPNRSWQAQQECWWRVRLKVEDVW